MPVVSTTGSQADPLTTTAGFSFLVSWRIHQRWLMDWNCYSGWAKPIKGLFEHWAAFPSFLSSSRTWTDSEQRWTDQVPQHESLQADFRSFLKQWKRSILRCQTLKNISEQEHSLSPTSLVCPTTASGFNISPSSPPTVWVADNVPSKPRKQQLQIFVQSQAASPSPVRNGMTLIW